MKLAPITLISAKKSLEPLYSGESRIPLATHVRILLST